VTQRGFRIFVDQLARGDQVARHRIGGSTIQCAQFAPDFGCQLLGVHVGRYRGPILRSVITVAAAALWLDWACPARARPVSLALGARPASRCAPRLRARSSFTVVTLPIVDHSAKDTGSPVVLSLEPVRQQRRHHRRAVGRDRDECKYARVLLRPSIAGGQFGDH
jgi:hypothetical protein